jgi:hypothetical protein
VIFCSPMSICSLTSSSGATTSARSSFTTAVEGEVI